MNPVVLVTGGAGYIGSQACKQLAASGFEPVTYDSLERGHRELVKWGPLVEGDLLDRERLASLLKRLRPAAVMHFAGLISVGESTEHPERYQRANVEGSLSLLHAMAEAKVPRWVFSSTAAVYGEPQTVPLDESHPLEPVNPYGQTKLDTERHGARWAADTGGSVVAFRYFNAAGADLDGDTGEWHEPETHLVPLALAAAAGDIDRLTVYGDDYDTPDGTCIRDYIHVADLADAHLLGLHQGVSRGATDIFNLGNGAGFSVRDVLRITQKVTGREVPFEIGPRRAGDPPRLVANAERARERLGWQPQHSDLSDILGSAWAWYQKLARGL